MPTSTCCKDRANLGRPREIVADPRCGSARRGRAPACAACADCDARAVCADRRPAGQHARLCVRRAATLRVPACRTYDPTPARVRESTRRADCNADVTAPSTDTLRIGVPPKRITRTTAIDRRRSEHRGPRGLEPIRITRSSRGRARRPRPRRQAPNARRRGLVPRRGRLGPTTQASAFAAGRSRHGCSDRLLGEWRA
jgi:hypothetical protein